MNRDLFGKVSTNVFKKGWKVSIDGTKREVLKVFGTDSGRVYVLCEDLCCYEVFDDNGQIYYSNLCFYYGNKTMDEYNNNCVLSGSRFVMSVSPAVP